MPIRLGVRTGEIARIYESPFVGPVHHQVGILVNISALTSDEVDAKGYLKPGIPFTRDGTLVGASPAFVFGVSIEEIKVADDNTVETLEYLGEVEVAVALICAVNQEVAEDLLGRAYTADEIAGFNRAGSKCVLLTPSS